jgi:hypothetical protein
MKRFSKMVILGIATALFVLSGCNGKDKSSGNDDNPDETGDCAIDDSSDPTMTPDANWEITSGQDSPQNYVCPPNDIDYFWFTAAAKSIVSVHLRNNVATSQVDLCYTIITPAIGGNPSKEIPGKCHGDAQGQIDLKGTYFLLDAGTYFLKVHSSNAKEDRRNPYVVTITLEADPDSNETNNSKADVDLKTPIAVPEDTNTSVSGYLSFLGDQDWFKINVPSSDGTYNKLLVIGLATDKVSELNLRYEVYDSKLTLINSGEKNDSINLITIEDVLALPLNGDYYILIKDKEDGNSDTKTKYTMTLHWEKNKDPQDNSSQNGNNSPEHATDLNIAGGQINVAYIASRADEDWYKITTNQNIPALIDVDLSISNQKRINPEIVLMYADTGTPCDGKCEVLTSTCGTGCRSWETGCRNAQCSSHECLDTSFCRGGRYCLSGSGGTTGCAINSLIMKSSIDPVQNWSYTESNNFHLRTIAPMFAQVYYIVVRHLLSGSSTPYDNANPYSLTVSVHQESDPHEMNSLYLPYINNQQEREAIEFNTTLATPTQIICTSLGSNRYQCQATGAISFRADQDWYVLMNSATVGDYFPPDTTEPTNPGDLSLKLDWQLTIDWHYSCTTNCPTNPLNFIFEVYPNDRLTSGDVLHRWEKDGPGDATFGGASSCGFICGEYVSRPIYIRVRHYNENYWSYDYNNLYSFTITADPGCPQNCGKCKLSCNDHACPNPLHLNPGTDGSGDCTDGPFN